ncbi:DNA-processing protein DprA [Furfurilactobacillus curtus]|uniref:DNA processing protein DprA n=1 Tax=Furfurilactobacillus curtus TaxID=1746200 RepID=A0ABQ5JQ23_9LACO
MNDPFASNRDFLVKFHFLPGIGLAKRRQLWAYLRSHIDTRLTLARVAEVLDWSTDDFHQAQIFWQSVKLANQIDLNQATSKITTILDPDYPPFLRELYAAPLVLFSRGNWQLTSCAGLAVVGARKATAYSRLALKRLLPPLLTKQTHPPIISGLASGVDAFSHQLAIQYETSTVAVIGTGLDVTYPAAHQSLQAELMTHQLVISEYPLGTPPARFRFPERNRIIAGLSQAVLVTEAAQHSGSLITANIALQENRNVLAVPGRITDPLSQGCNALISAGATPITTATELMAELRDE